MNKMEKALSQIDTWYYADIEFSVSNMIVIDKSFYWECVKSCKKLPREVNRYGYWGRLSNGMEFVVNPFFTDYVIRFWKRND